MVDSGTRDRAEGAMDEMKGKGKQAWGDATGDDSTKADGMMDEAKGKGEGLLGDIKKKAEDLKEDAERKM